MTQPPDRPAGVDARAMFDRDAGSYYLAKYGRGGDLPQQYAFAQRLRLVVHLLDRALTRMRGLQAPPLAAGSLPGASAGAWVAEILDVGCGPGVMIEPVMERGGRLTGLDLSPEMVARAQERAEGLGAGARCRFAVGSAEALPFADGAFDAVTAMGVIEYVPHDARALAEMARVVRPGGVVIVTVPNLLSPWRFLPVLAKGLFPRPLKIAVRRFLRGAVRGAEARAAGPAASACELDRFPRRLYPPWTLDLRLARAGLRKQIGVFHNFRVPALGTLFPEGSVRVARELEPLGRSNVLGWMGGGYIAMASRISA